MIFGQAARFWGTANVTQKRTESRGLGVEDPQELSSLFLSGFHAARVHGQIDRCPFFMRLSALDSVSSGHAISIEYYKRIPLLIRYIGSTISL